MNATHAHYSIDRPRHRRAVTLVELLIVISLVLLLAGISLPSIKGVMKDQRISQSARLFQGFLESARARAIALDRPVAAIVERFGTAETDVNGLRTSIRMSIGEVFPPYEGDWANTFGTLEDSNSDGYIDRIRIMRAQAATLQSFVSAGDSIQIGDSLQPFEIRTTTVQNPYVYVEFINPPTNSEARLPSFGTGTEVRFKVFRKPSKTMASDIVLPKGTCVDLGWSGFGEAGRELNVWQATTIPSRRSLFIVFNTRGTVSAMYEFQEGIGTNTNQVTNASSSIGLLHFLVGRTDQIDSPAPVSDRDDVKSNLIDTSNKWVTLNTINGQVYTSDVGSPDGTVPSARLLATQHRSAKE